MQIFLSLLIGYLGGNLLFAKIIGQLFLHKDPAQYGSHNPGTANMGAVFGKKWGILTCLGDLAKSLLALFLVFALFHNRELLPWASLGLLLGHCFPFWNHFQGGKGVAVAAAFSVCYDWRAGLVTLLIALILTALMQNLTIPPLVFMLFFSLYVMFTHTLTAGLIFLACTAVMAYRFRFDLADFFAGRGKRVDILRSIKRKLGINK